MILRSLFLFKKLPKLYYLYNVNSKFIKIKPQNTLKNAYFFSLISFLTLTNPILSQVLTNDLEVAKINCLGTCMLFHSQNIEVIIKNNGLATQSNITVSLTVSGSNSFINTQTFVSLPYNGTISIIFSPFTPSIIGTNSVFVTVPTDQNNMNNFSNAIQNVTCFNVSVAPQIPDSSFKGSGYGNSSILFKYNAPIQSTSIIAVGCVVPSFSLANNLGKQIAPILYNMNTQQMFVGDTVTIQNKHLDTLSYYSFKKPIQLISNNDYLIGISPLGYTYWPIGNTTSPTYSNSLNFYFSQPIGFSSASPTTFSVTGYLSLNGKFINANNTLTLSSTGWHCRSSTKPTLIAAQGCQSYTWSNGATNDSIFVAPFSTSIYSVTGTNSLNCLAEKSIIINVYFDCFLNSNDIFRESFSIEIMPNPTKRFIKVNNLNSSLFKYVIEDLSGRAIKSDILNQSSTIEVSDLENAIYIIKFYINDQIYGSSKFIKSD